MLAITVLGNELFNDETQEFETTEDVVLELEHSLLSLSKWEQIYEKPFLGKAEKTVEETLGYVKAMVLGPEPSPDVFSRLSDENLNEISNYINAKATATTFHEAPGRGGSRETITSELVYYWMVELRIPFTCENWHLNRLFALIKVVNLKRGKQKKMSRSEAAAQQRELNAKRKAQHNTRG